MYEATIFDIGLERMYTVVNRDAREAVTLAWRANVQDHVDDDASAWEPDGLRLTTTKDEELRALEPLSKEVDGLRVIVDRDRLTHAIGFVRPVG